MMTQDLGEPAGPGVQHKATAVGASDVGAQLFPLPPMRRRVTESHLLSAVLRGEVFGEIVTWVLTA